VEVFSGSRRLGTQDLNLLNEDTEFALTTKPTDTGAMRELLHHTRLKAIQWINLNRHLVEFTTVGKSKS
jgi:ketosteroid isomerase-like protein